MNTLERAKYRGKCVETGKWCVGSLNHFEDSATINICRVVNANIGQPENIQVEMDVDPETVGQWTGLTDKSGADIYEGDLLDFDQKEWGDNDLRDKPECISSIPVGEWPYCGSVSDVSEWRQVVGNIHDNPELLEL